MYSQLAYRAHHPFSDRVPTRTSTYFDIPSPLGVAWSKLMHRCRSSHFWKLYPCFLPCFFPQVGHYYDISPETFRGYRGLFYRDSYKFSGQLLFAWLRVTSSNNQRNNQPIDNFNDLVFFSYFLYQTRVT